MKKNEVPQLDVPKPMSYEERQAELRAAQAGMSREQIAEQMTAESEGVFDPETAVAPTHHWVDRGAVMSCEGAGHPTHRHFKFRRA